ncbi:tyrosine-type recombinase/integrase [Lacipirellula sp.]|uniref:tyrosine-type recombinase/integrase n=1 Tax=Lacipirellula sp. TaxID=2691419 RepID=UPI003D0CCDD5
MTWTVARSRVLTRSEIQAVLADLKRKARRSPNTAQNLILFRLACCCGLRASELTRLRLCDLRVSSTKPTIKVPKTIAKGAKERIVPLWWDGSTLDDLRAWKAAREAQGALGSDSLLVTRTGGQIDRLNARKRFQACCRVLGAERHVTIHDGRHSFISHALHAGRSIAEVRDAAGHSNIATTSVYTHLVSDGDETVGNLFD